MENNIGELNAIFLQNISSILKRKNSGELIKEYVDILIKDKSLLKECLVFKHIEETEDTPRVILDKINNVFEISGMSIPEDPSKFYHPVIKWFEEYIKDPNSYTEFILKFEYFNSASAKQIVELLSKLEKIKESDRRIKVIWHYNKEDELMETKVEAFKSVIDIPFELIAY